MHSSTDPEQDPRVAPSPWSGVAASLCRRVAASQEPVAPSQEPVAPWPGSDVAASPRRRVAVSQVPVASSQVAASPCRRAAVSQVPVAAPPTRRHFLITTAALAGCARRPRSEASVTIARAPHYGQELYELVRRMLAEQKLDVRGRRVVIKPNLVEFEPGSAINTHPMVVHAALEAFRALGAADVRLAEGPGHRRNTLDLADAAGYFQTIPHFEDLFTDLNLDEVSQVRLSRPSSRLNTLYLPKTALASDLLVSLPKMKTHHWAGATLSMKNLFGLVPGGVYGWPKNVLHWAGINECIADLYRTFPRHFALVDGIVGMEGNGPIQGTPKPAGVLVAGRDLAAVDATCCRIMGIDPAKIAYLQIAGLPPVKQTGERVESVRTPFQLLPVFQFLRSV